MNLLSDGSILKLFGNVFHRIAIERSGEFRYLDIVHLGMVKPKLFPRRVFVLESQLEMMVLMWGDHIDRVNKILGR